MVLLVSVFGSSFVLSVEEPLLVSSLASTASFGLKELVVVLCMLWGVFTGDVF